MKLKVSFVLLTTLFVVNGVFADDEFPSYLSEKYCQGIKLDFMTSSIKSLQRYRDKQLTSQHRGGMNNIRKFLEQRQDWMLECDQYLSKTGKQRLFLDKKTTESVFSAIDSVASELNSLVNGVTYSVENGGSPTDVAAEKFDQLFKLVDNHQTMLLMKGQVVYR
ncbi:hypothetical protein G8770_16420 [Aestuariicella hydrocarbonica]|uniref:Lysozyme inhibitor LprI N-terminal domain-containing protein n=1 Tax=Pseudomaricurvus hydrocarbonicus TaxID=1470433 RepID=A0A9E5MMT4_9GAMM|nr:hypothetical protein [Aestuariicella hydrocarbonica]NHO67134.1 hypothetical protein [Aestuariicella hydrocarbonica]